MTIWSLARTSLFSTLIPRQEGHNTAVLRGLVFGPEQGSVHAEWEVSVMLRGIFCCGVARKTNLLGSVVSVFLIERGTENLV